MPAYPLTARVPVGRSRLLVGLVLALTVFLGLGAPQAARAAVTPPSVTITPAQTLTEVRAAVAAIGVGQSIELITPGTLKVNKGAVCTLTVTVALYAFSSAVVSYLAAAGVVVTVLGVAIGAGTLASIAAGTIKWPVVYSWVGKNVCA